MDKRKEFEVEVLPLINQLAALCEELGVGFVMGFCPANDVEREGHDERGYSICVRTLLAGHNTTCQMMAAAILLDEEVDHPLSHAVLEAKKQQIEMEESLPELLKWLEMHKDEVNEAIQDGIRKMEQEEAAKFN
jgi:hypothetical protein